MFVYISNICRQSIKFNSSKIITAFAILCCLVTMYSRLYSVSVKSRSVPNHENVSCHYERGDKLPLVSDRGFNPPAQSIFFHETSCRGGLNSRQACAVESAAIAHKLWNVYVLFLAPLKTLDTKGLRVLQQYEKVKIARINILDYAKNTPVESLVSSGALNRTQWWMVHTSDTCRYLTMYKFGGIYLDLDTVVVKPLGGLKNNWAAREDDEVVANGAMAFSRDHVGRMYAKAVIRNLAETYKSDLWSHNGPGVITRVLNKKCGTEDTESMTASICQGFEVYSSELFYPIDWMDTQKFFKPGKISKTPYIYHLWNRLTKHTQVLNNSLYAALARKYCPKVYAAYGDEFGN